MSPAGQGPRPPRLALMRPWDHNDERYWRVTTRAAPEFQPAVADGGFNFILRRFQTSADILARATGLRCATAANGHVLKGKKHGSRLKYGNWTF